MPAAAAVAPFGADRLGRGGQLGRLGRFDPERLADLLGGDRLAEQPGLPVRSAEAAQALTGARVLDPLGGDVPLPGTGRVTGGGEDGVKMRRNGDLSSGAGCPVHRRPLVRRPGLDFARRSSMSFDGPQPAKERLGENQPPFSRCLGDRTAGRRQLLVRPAAEKSYVGLHSLCPVKAPTPRVVNRNLMKVIHTSSRDATAGFGARCEARLGP